MKLTELQQERYEKLVMWKNLIEAQKQLVQLDELRCKDAIAKFEAEVSPPADSASTSTGSEAANEG